MYDLQSSLNVQCTWGSGLNLLEPLKEEVEIKPHFSRTAGFWYNGTEKISWNALRQATRPSRHQLWDREVGSGLTASLLEIQGSRVSVEVMPVL